MTIFRSIRWFFRDDGKDAQRLRKLAKIALIVVLFIGLFWIAPIDQVVQAVLRADPWLLAAGILVSFLSTALTAFELEPLTRHQGIRHSALSILEINLAVKFYAQFMPTSLVGSGMRWYRLAQPGDKLVESLAALAFFRVLETFLTITTGVSFWLLAGQERVQVNLAWLILVIVGIIAGWVVVTRSSIPLYRWFKAHGGGFLDRPFWKPVNRKIEKSLTAISAYAAMPARNLILAVFSGLVSVLLGIFSGLLIAQSIGIQIGYLELGWMQAIILLTTQLPFAVAGGLGIREVTLVALFAGFGVGAELALAYSFLLFVRGLLISLPGGLIEAYRAWRGSPIQNVDAAAVSGRKAPDPKES